MYSVIDLNSWVRKELYAFFQTYDDPTWDLCAEINITVFYKAVKQSGDPFFLAFIQAAAGVCNSIEALRMRISADGEVRCYNTIHPGSTLLYDNGTYGYGYFDYTEDYHQFMRQAVPSFEQQKKEAVLDPRNDDLARIYFSPIPWVSFTGFRHPFRKAGNTSIPMVVFGKHFLRDEKRIMPVGLTLHHGLADGYHAGLFFTKLEERMLRGIE